MLPINLLSLKGIPLFVLLQPILPHLPLWKLPRTHCLHLGRHIHLPATPICRRFLCLPSTATITKAKLTCKEEKREREIWLEYCADMEKSQNKFVSRCQLIRRPHCAYAPCCVLWYVMRRNCFTFCVGQRTFKAARRRQRLGSCKHVTNHNFDLQIN